METNFSKPQRQSPIGVLVMFFDTLQQWARGLWPVLVVWIFKFDELDKGYLFLGTTTVLLAIGLVAYLKYLNFTFYLDNDNEENSSTVDQITVGNEVTIEESEAFRSENNLVSIR